MSGDAVKQYLYQVRPRRLAMITEGPDETESAVLRDHLEYLERLAEEGIVLLSGRTQTADRSTFGIVILQAESETVAKGIVAADPAVEHGVMDAQLFPYQIAVLSDSIKKPAR
ncbi:MAG: YciI family protein [Gammaproteobacteria bacterium]|nr:YciI family protein [Gammaproteobacteria bacterium]